jgi:hypothetical protein
VPQAPEVAGVVVRDPDAGATARFEAIGLLAEERDA